jgi:predicted small metal-binding protein
LRPQRLRKLIAAGQAVPIDNEIREQEAALPPGQLSIDPPTGHSGNEPTAELDPGSLSTLKFIGHSAKLAPKRTSNNLANATGSRGGEQMTYVLNCDCGYIARGETEDELVEETTRHIEEVHPDLAGQVSRDDLLAMAEEV